MTAPDPEHYGTLLTELTLNLAVRDVGAVLSLLRDAGYEVEVNVARSPETQS